MLGAGCWCWVLQNDALVRPAGRRRIATDSAIGAGIGERSRRWPVATANTPSTIHPIRPILGYCRSTVPGSAVCQGEGSDTPVRPSAKVTPECGPPGVPRSWLGFPGAGLGSKVRGRNRALSTNRIPAGKASKSCHWSIAYRLGDRPTTTVQGTRPPTNPTGGDISGAPGSAVSLLTRTP